MKKTIIAIISVVLILATIAVGVTAYASDLYTLPVSEWGERLGIESKPAEPEQEKPGDVTPGGNTQQPGEQNPGTVVINPMEIKLNQKEIALTNSVAPSEEFFSEAIRLSAEVLPKETIKKELKWDFEFADPSSEWALGKNVEDYINIIVQDDSRSALIKCLQPFGEQIIITAESVNGRVKDKCIVDFRQFATEYYVEYDGVKVEYQDDTEGMFTSNFECELGIAGPEHTIAIHYALSDVYTQERIVSFGIIGTTYHRDDKSHTIAIDDSSLSEGKNVVKFNMDRNILTSGSLASYEDKTGDEIREIIESIGTCKFTIWNSLGIPDIVLKIDLEPISTIIEPTSIKVGDLAANTLLLHPYQNYKYMIGQGENPMPNSVTATYSDGTEGEVAVTWKNQNNEIAQAIDYISTYYTSRAEYDAEDNFITAEVVVDGRTYTFPMNVKICSGSISKMEFYLNNEWVDNLPSGYEETTEIAARVTFADDYIFELPAVIRPSTAESCYVYIGYDKEKYDLTGAVVEYADYSLKQAKRFYTAIVPTGIKVAELAENTLELHPYQLYEYIIGEGENPMPDSVTLIYNDGSEGMATVTWKNQSGDIAEAKDYISTYYPEDAEYSAEDNFITAEVVDKGITYTFPMNVKIYRETIASIKFFVDGELRDSVPEDMVGGVQLAASVTFDSGYTTELATYIREGTNGYGYAYIGYDIENCESTGELTEYEGYRFKQAKRIRIDSSAGV